MGLLVSVFAAVANFFRGQKKDDQNQRNKFEIQDGITLFDNQQSPCARRVRMTLLEKGLDYKKVEINLLKGEQLTKEYTKICPNKKVPAAAFKNVQGIEDCVVFESNVITELLDADIFEGRKLYPGDPWERAQVKMWQDWELGLVDDFVPFVYQNMLPFSLSAIYPTKGAFLKTLPKKISPAKREHWEKTYDGKIASAYQMEQHAIACYQNLCELEVALKGKTYLVGDKFTTADLSVLPRVSMFNSVGLTIPESLFPNTTKYIKHLGSRPSVIRSQSFGASVAAWVSSHIPSVLVALGNWRSRRSLSRFEGLGLANRAVKEWNSNQKHTSLWDVTVSRLVGDAVLVADCPVSVNSWQIKLLLMEKGTDFSTCCIDVTDLIGHWAGSGSITKIKHGEHCVTGIRAIVDYLDSVFGEDGDKLLPTDPLQRAQVQCWQAWDQTMGYLELGPLLEATVIARILVSRYEKDMTSLLAVAGQPQHKAKFRDIVRSFICGLVPDNPLLTGLLGLYGELVEEALSQMMEVANQRLLLVDRLHHLEQSLEGKLYLVGDNLTLADLLIFCRLCFVPYVGLQLSAQEFLTTFPNITRWTASLETRPAFKQVAQSIAAACTVEAVTQMLVHL